MEIRIPDICPSCGTALEATELELFCRNKESCPAQNLKRLEHFCKTMGIKGLAEARLELLMDNGLVQDVFSIYELTLEEITSILGSAIGTTLFGKIQQSKQTEPAKLLSALGISKVGKTVSEKIMMQVGHKLECLGNVQYEKGAVGNVVVKSIKDWISTPEYQKLLSVDWEFNIVEKPQASKTDVICITGKLNDFTNRKSAEQFLNEKGFVTKASITKDVTILICEDGNESSSSYKKALEKGITITTIYNLLNPLEG